MVVIIELEKQPTDKLIKILKIYNDCNSKELAEKIGVSYSTLVQIEARTKNGTCTYTTARKIAKAFNLDLKLMLQAAEIHNYNVMEHNGLPNKSYYSAIKMGREFGEDEEVQTWLYQGQDIHGVTE